MTLKERMNYSDSLLDKMGANTVCRIPGEKKQKISFEIKLLLSLCEAAPPEEEYPAFGVPTEVSVGCFGLTAGGENFPFTPETQKAVHAAVVRKIYEESDNFGEFRKRLRELNDFVQTDFSGTFRDERVRELLDEGRSSIRETRENYLKQYGLNSRYSFFQTFAFHALPDTIPVQKRLEIARDIAGIRKEYLSLKKREKNIRTNVHGGTETDEYREIVRSITKHRTDLLNPEAIRDRTGVTVSREYSDLIISSLDKRREEFFQEALRESGEFSEEELEIILRYPKNKLVVAKDIVDEITAIAKKRYKEQRVEKVKGEFSEKYNMLRSRLHAFSAALSMEKARKILNSKTIAFPYSIASAYAFGKSVADINVQDHDIQDNVTLHRDMLELFLVGFLHSKKEAKHYVNLLEQRYREFYNDLWYRRCKFWVMWGDMPKEIYHRMDELADEQERKTKALIREDVPMEAQLDTEETKQKMFQNVYRHIHNQSCPAPLYVYVLPTGLVGIDGADRVSILPVHPIDPVCTRILSREEKAVWCRCWAAARRKHFRELDTVVRRTVMNMTSELIQNHPEECPAFYRDYLRMAEKRNWPENPLLNLQSGCFRPRMEEEDFRVLKEIPEKFLAYVTNIELIECRVDPESPEKLIAEALAGGRLRTMSILMWEPGGNFSLRLRCLRRFLDCYEPESVYAFFGVCIASAVFDSLTPEQKEKYRARLGTKVNLSKAQFHTLFGAAISDAKKRSEIMVRTLFISEYRKKYLMTY